MKTDYRKLFEFYGARDIREQGNQFNCTYPFSIKQRKGYFNPETGCWDEKQRVLSGNHSTIAEPVYEHLLKHTPDGALGAVAEWRGFSEIALRWWGFVSDGTFVYDPVTNIKGAVVALRRCPLNGRDRKWMGPPGVPVDISGWGRLRQAKPGSLVLLTEGAWDGAAAHWAARAAGATAAVLALPGASVFKPEWAQRLAGFNVVCCYDADDAGAKGEQRAAAMLAQYGVKPRFLNWSALLVEVSHG